MNLAPLRIQVLRDALAPFHALSERERVEVLVAEIVPCEWVHGKDAPCAKCGPPQQYDVRPMYLRERLDAAKILLGKLR